MAKSMKTLAMICVLTLSAIGCASDRPQQDSFASLHDLVKRTLANSCHCGPIVTNEVAGGRYFEVKPQPRGLLITVSERQFFSQTEWEKRYSSGTNLMGQFLELGKTNYSINANQTIDAKTLARFVGVTNAFGLLELPEWHYQNIGVHVGVQEIDVSYPGLDRDDAEAQKRRGEIVRLLTPYHQATQK